MDEFDHFNTESLSNKFRGGLFDRQFGFTPDKPPGKHTFEDQKNVMKTKWPAQELINKQKKSGHEHHKQAYNMNMRSTKQKNDESLNKLMAGNGFSPRKRGSMIKVGYGKMAGIPGQHKEPVMVGSGFGSLFKGIAKGLGGLLKSGTKKIVKNAGKIGKSALREGVNIAKDVGQQAAKDVGQQALQQIVAGNNPLSKESRKQTGKTLKEAGRTAANQAIGKAEKGVSSNIVDPLRNSAQEAGVPSALTDMGSKKFSNISQRAFDAARRKAGIQQQGSGILGTLGNLIF